MFCCTALREQGTCPSFIDAVISSVEAESKVQEKEEDEQAKEWGDMDEAGWQFSALAYQSGVPLHVGR